MRAGGPRASTDAGAAARRLEETIDLLWQTDELRVARPDPIDEARNAVYYFDDLHADAVPDVLEEMADELTRAGSWTAEPERAAAPVRQLDRRRPRREPERGARQHRGPTCSALQHDHALRDAIAVVNVLRRDLSSSERIAGATPGLREVARARPGK